MATHGKTDNKAALKATGKAIVSAGVTGAFAFSGAGLAAAVPQINHQRASEQLPLSTQDLLKRLVQANDDLANLQDQLAQDRERANKALVDLQNARKNAANARHEATEAAESLSEAQRSLVQAQKHLNEIAAQSYRSSATTNSTLDLMSGEDPDSIVARQAVIDRAAAQQSALVDELKQARTETERRQAAAAQAEQLAELAHYRAYHSNQDANDVLLAATTAVRTRQQQIDALIKDRAQLAMELQSVTDEVEPVTPAGTETPPINEEALRESVSAAAEVGAIVVNTPVDLSEIQTVGDLVKLPLEVLKSIPPEVWERLGNSVQAQVEPYSPEAAAALGVAQDTALAQLPHLALLTDNIELLTAIPDAILSSGSSDLLVPTDTTTPDTPAAGNATATGNVEQPSNNALHLATMFLPSRQKVERVINRGMSQLGVPYAWGGGDVNGPTRGIRDGGVADAHGDYMKIGYDCSGLMVFAFAALGYNLPHYSGYQYTSGLQLPVSQMMRGDMIFYGSGGSQHVALYLGDGMMLEAPQSGDVVRVNPVRWDGMTPYVVRMVTS